MGINEGVYIRFNFGQNDVFPIRCLVYFNRLLVIPRIEGHRGRYFIASLQSFWQFETLLWVIECYVNTTLKWNHLKWNICACEYFITTKMVENLIISYLFEKTTEKTRSGIMSFSEKDAPKWIIEKQTLGLGKANVLCVFVAI